MQTSPTPPPRRGFVNAGVTPDMVQIGNESKKVWIAETAYYWTANQAGYGGSQVPYAQTPAGQYAFLRALVDVVDGYSNVAGIFYWGAGWSESSRWLVAPGWSNDDAHCRALFDDRGRATQGIDGL